MQPKLASTSWQDLGGLLSVYAKQLIEYKELADRIGLQTPIEREFENGGLRNMPLDRAKIVSKWFLDVKRLYAHIDVINAEIRRRKTLVGVIG